MSQSLVRYEPPPTRELQTRVLRLGRLRRDLSELEQRYESVRAEIEDFERRYRPAVGERQRRLESLRKKIAKAWEQVRRARSGEPLEPSSETGVSKEIPQDTFRPEVDLKKLFRELARLCHPDLATDPEERQRRHEFMAEASRAYRGADHLRLQWLLEHWEATPTLPPGVDPSSRLEKTNQQIAWARYRIQEMNQLIAATEASTMADLMREAQDARSKGRNYIVEMRRQVLDETEQAQRDLEGVEQALAELDQETVKVIRANSGLEELKKATQTVL